MQGVLAMNGMNKLPFGWKKITLESICDLQAGKFVGASEILVVNDGSTFPCYGGNGLRGYVKEFSHDGTFPLIGRQGALCGNVHKVTGKFYATEHAVVATPHPNIDVNWLYYQLTHENLNKYATGAAQPGLSVKNINELLLTHPPLSEQKAIADLLSTWDEAIEKTEWLIQAKVRQFKGYIQQTIGLKCEEWLHIKPKKIFDTITEKGFPDEELLSVTQDRGVIPRSMLDGRVMSPDGTTDSYKRIKCGDFAISLRSFQGGIEYSKYQGLISPAYTVLRPKMEINVDFYRLFFKSYLFVEKYLSLAVIGIRDGKQISIPDFMSIKIPVPPLQEQQQIAETLNAAQKEIDLLKQLLEKYKSQKRGLMQKMLSGEWRVKPEIVNQYMEA
jgi:type I restriction enzyme S subunit